MIVLVTHEQDITCDLVVLRLRERDIPYLRLNTDTFLGDGGLNWAMRPGRPASSTLRWRETTVDVAGISAVWYRRPVTPHAPRAVSDPGGRHFAAQEGAALLQNLWALVDGLWVSPPEAIRQAEPKLHQLERAHSLGFDIPDTLVTNDQAEARAFCRNHDEVITKPLGRSTVDDPETGVRSVIFTNRVRASDLARLEAVALTPTLFQQSIPKYCDLRVTVVGRQVFAVEIRVAGYNDEIDWRRVGIAPLHHTLHVLPPVMTTRVRALVQHLGLQFGALDFVITPDGRYVFLEINPNGQWAWLEHTLGAPISSALVDLLNGDVPPL